MMRSKTVRRLLDERERSFERERQGYRQQIDQLLDRIMYLADRPWNPPPELPSVEGPPSEPVLHAEQFQPEELIS